MLLPDPWYILQPEDLQDEHPEPESEERFSGAVDRLYNIYLLTNLRPIIDGQEYDIGLPKYLFQFSVRNFLSKNEIYLSMYITKDRDVINLHNSEKVKNQKKGIFVEFEKFAINSNRLQETSDIKLEISESVAGNNTPIADIGNSS